MAAPQDAPTDPPARVVSDPLALRALAHPLRRQLADLVGREGTLTGADAARQLGISQALASHHLRQLAKYGFIEPAGADDQRSRPWKVTATSTRFVPTEAEGREASDYLQGYAVERLGQQLDDWHELRREMDPRWVELSDVMNGLLYLTVEEMAELRAELEALVTDRANQRRVGDHASRPAGAVPVAFTFAATPVRPTERGG